MTKLLRPKPQGPRQVFEPSSHPSRLWGKPCSPPALHRLWESAGSCREPCPAYSRSSTQAIPRPMSRCTGVNQEKELALSGEVSRILLFMGKVTSSKARQLYRLRVVLFFFFACMQRSFGCFGPGPILSSRPETSGPPFDRIQLGLAMDDSFALTSQCHVFNLKAYRAIPGRLSRNRARAKKLTSCS